MTKIPRSTKDNYSEEIVHERINRRYTQMDADLPHRICVYPCSSAVKNIRENFQEKPRLLRLPKEIIQRKRLSYVIPAKTKAKFDVFLTEHNYESG